MLKLLLLVSRGPRPGQVVGTAISLATCWFFWRGSKFARGFLVVCVFLAIGYGIAVSSDTPRIALVAINILLVALLLALLAPATSHLAHINAMAPNKALKIDALKTARVLASHWAMNKLPAFVFLFCLWTISPCFGQEVAIQQLWLSYETWPDKPTGEDEPWTTPGVVVAFCPDGQFRMASGLLYRAENGAGLGASDGIATFRGEWSGTLMDLTVSYALASGDPADWSEPERPEAKNDKANSCFSSR